VSRVTGSGGTILHCVSQTRWLSGRYIIRMQQKYLKEWETYGPPTWLMDSYNVAPTQLSGYSTASGQKNVPIYGLLFRYLSNQSTVRRIASIWFSRFSKP
jgi:hypothetical protein